jgi:hypothetical protein
MVFSILWAGLFLGISAPIWYTAAQLWLNKGSDAAEAVRVAEHKDSVGVCLAAGQKCFDVRAPNGSRYVVKVRDTESEASAAKIVRLNPDKFAEPPQDPKGGWGNDPFFVDLTGPWIVTGVEALDLSSAKLFTVIALAVPLAVLALGYSVGWAVMGFRQS